MEVDRAGGEPVNEFDRILDISEVRQLGANIVWPAVDRVFGDNFIYNASVGENVTFERTVIDEKAGEQTRVTVSGECYINTDLSFQSSRCFSATITIESRRDELIEGMLLASGCRAAADKYAADAPGDDVDELDGMSAWNVKCYIFTTSDSAPMEASQHDYHKLYDADGDEIWSDADIWIDDSDNTLSGSEIDDLEQLDDRLFEAMTESDRLNILTNLLLVGLQQQGSH